MPTVLAGILRLGGWHHFGMFDHQRLDPSGVSGPAHPLSNGVARRFRGATGIYGVVDHKSIAPRAVGRTAASASSAASRQLPPTAAS